MSVTEDERDLMPLVRLVQEAMEEFGVDDPVLAERLAMRAVEIVTIQERDRIERLVVAAIREA